MREHPSWLCWGLITFMLLGCGRQPQQQDTSSLHASFNSSLAGSLASFDASPSTPTSGIARYDWDFGDGSTGSGMSASHQYALTTSTWVVSLTVTDAQGRSSATAQIIPITVAPSAGLLPPANTGTGTTTGANAGVTSYTVAGTIFEMVSLPGGSFTMGSPTGEPGHLAGEAPQHQVTIPPFAIGKFEVTQGLWLAVMNSNPSWFQGGNLPVERVSWLDIQTFITKLNAMTGKSFRLPSESEWEYACRGGTTTPYYGGTAITPNDANFNMNIGRTLPVGSYPPNPFGLYDMTGNVWEWVQDWYHTYYTGAPSDGSAWETGGGTWRVARGGGWDAPPDFQRIAFRLSASPNLWGNIMGFRLAL